MEKTAETRASMVDEARRSVAGEGALDVAALAANLGLEVYQERLPDNNGGYIAYDGEDTFIVVNAGHPITRQRFTIAHELGHYVNDWERLQKEGRLDRDKSAASATSEIEADQYAAAILMPEEDTRSFVSLLGPSEITAKVVEQVAEHFNVSKTMAIQRLREVGVTVPYIAFA